MKKLLGILVLGLLLTQNYSEAKTKDIGQGLTINIPNNYEYFEITLDKIYSEFPEIDNTDDELFKTLGIGGKTKIIAIANNKKTIKFFKQISNSEGLEKLIEEYWEPFVGIITGEEFLKLVEKEFKKMGKDPSKMSEKKMEATMVKISKKPSFQKKIDKLVSDNPIFAKFEKEYSFDMYTILLIGDKKINSDLTKLLEIMSPSEIKKNIKDFIKLMAKEDLTMEPLKKWKFKVKKNHNGKLYLYSDDPIDDPYTKKKADLSEIFLSTNNEQTFLAWSICSENCKKTDLSEIITPTNLFVKSSKKTETKEKKTDSNNNLSEQLKDLNELYKSGALTKEEFEKAKKKLLN